LNSQGTGEGPYEKRDKLLKRKGTGNHSAWGIHVGEDAESPINTLNYLVGADEKGAG